MELIVKTLSTMVIMAVVVLETVKFLPSTSVLPMENSVSEPLLRVLTQLMEGRGEPSAVQFRENGAGRSCCTMLTGSVVIVGATAGSNVIAI